MIITKKRIAYYNPRNLNAGVTLNELLDLPLYVA